MFNIPPTLLSSQQSDSGDDDLVQRIEASESTNTKMTTSWGFTKLTKWLEKRNIQLDSKPVTEEKLCDTLRKFYAEVKSENKGALTPSKSLLSLIVRLQP